MRGKCLEDLISRNPRQCLGFSSFLGHIKELKREATVSEMEIVQIDGGPRNCAGCIRADN